jgi:S1-C subfamily serine protease
MPDSKGVIAALKIPACPAISGARLPNDVSRILPAVVTLRAGGASGTGVVISPDGYVFTAAHLVAGATGVTATLPTGMQFDATVLRTDSAKDLAVLRIPGRGHACVPVAASTPLKIGEDVFVVGSPLGKSFESSISRGVLSGERTFEGVRYLQTDASVNPGSSGGPLFDSQGRVQAIVSGKIVGVRIEGIAFAIPVDLFARDLGVLFD